jgi:hypothetical protein
VGVTCAAASACWAVGSSYTSGVVNQTLIEYWDSSSWAVINSPNAIAPGPTANRITDVACLSASDCWAVGFYDADSQANYQTLTEHWDGTSWAIINSPNTNTELSNVLESVTCASTNDCWAVGDYISNNSFPQISKALIEHWDGHSWAIIDAPTGDFYWLQAVTCAASNNCWAVGYFAAGFYQTLIEHWDGTSWSIVSSANPAAAENNVLLAVTCASASDCWATGAYGRVFQTLIEHWDGTSWTVVSSPNASAVRDNLLQSIACASGSDCWAVGYYSAAGIYQTLIEHWNGTSWTIISSPNTDVAKSNILTAAACASGNDCWAVGYYSNGKYLQTLAQHWDGTSWTIAHSRNTSPTQSNYLLTVTCLSPSECWAAGSYDLAPNRFQTLIEHYSLSSVQLSTGVSRKTHGSAGTFDVDLPLDGSGIECRSGGQGGDYTMVFTFANPLTSVDGANVTSGAGSVSSSNVDSNDAHNYIVALTGVTNAQKITVSLTNVTDSFGNFSARVPISMAVLVGDTTGDAIVNSTDIAQSKSQSGQAVTDSNFREDVTADGNINSADIALTKSKSGTALPQ